MNKIKKLLISPDFYIEETKLRPSYEKFDLESQEVGKYNFLQDGVVNERYDFKGFLDGSMRLYKIGNAYETGTPFYVATISSVVLYRGKDRLLRNTKYSKKANIIIFPKECYLNTVRDSEIRKKAEEFVLNIKKMVEKTGGIFVHEYEINKYGGVEFLKKHNNFWIFSDITYEGVTALDLSSQRILIKQEDLFNPVRVKNAARARARFIMNLFEFSSAYLFVIDHQKSKDLFLIDGLIPRFSRISNTLCLKKSEYIKCVSRIAGFIKTPRVIPKDFSELKSLFTLKEGECKVYKGKPKDLEVYGEELLEVKEDIKDEDYFIFLKFRNIPYFESSSQSLVKIHLKAGENIRFVDIAFAIYNERLPLPNDKSRFFNEPFAIEEAERVAQTNLASEEEIRGFMLSLVYSLW
ncbi:hypothetical protein DRP07_12530 [Archaeoglobales archaeon]|nr:MAG: hypothetical protein DRP07_12530 [Archaeoglobales archaeon]